ncbi:MAG TPA: glucuronate isomerase, partial [bacterium]
FRPDNCTDLSQPAWPSAIRALSDLTGLDCTDYRQYIRALEMRRAFFKEMGATSTDHGVVTPFTAHLSDPEADRLFRQGIEGKVTADDAKLFTGHMLMEMARMSVEDGLVMQIHAGVVRNHNPEIFHKFGPDKGCDIPRAVDFVHDLRPLLNRFGNDSRFTVVCFTIDETTYSRELAPLAGHYPAMRIGPAWWFNDSLEGMLRFRRMTTETAGIYNTVGFNDDTRAFPSIPARHDLARRVDARYLAELVATHVIERDEAEEMIVDLAYRLPKKNYKF